MRIGIDGRELLRSNVTGIGRYLRNFLSSRVVRCSPYEFVVYGNQFTSPELSGPNVRFRIVPEHVTLWWDQVVLSRLAREDRIDLFLSPYDKGPFLIPCPLALTVHDLSFVFFPEHGAFLSRAYFVTRKLMARRADLIITVSERSKRDILKLFGVREDKVKVVPNGVPDEYRRVQDRSSIEQLKRKYRIPGDYILYVGNFKPHKNVRILIDAYKELPDPLKDKYYLVLCGRRDKFREEIETRIRSLRLEGKVVFLDFVPEEDMPVLYSGAEVFVFPSLYEGFGLPPLEAMACGTPVVCSNSSSLPEVVGEAGVLVDPHRPELFAEAMERVLTDGGLREDLGSKGSHRSRRFSSEDFSGRLLEILEELASSGGPRWRLEDRSS